MTEYNVTPEDAQQVLDRVRSGDLVELRAGTYSDRLRMKRRGSSQRAPIIVRAEAGAVLSPGVSAEDFRVEANHMAKAVYEGQVSGHARGSFPGLYPWMLRGQLVLERCENVTLEGLSIERTWPTLVALYRSSDIILRGCRFRDGTFAIAVKGSKAHRLTVEDCHWVQDREPGRMWTGIDWGSIHGDPDDEEDPRPVDVDDDWRLFDGDFLRTSGIRGAVTIRNCSVAAAFNAIHAFNRAKDPDLSRDFHVHDCMFREIRDNVLEPEDTAFNWWFYRNRIVNCHKWFSMECQHSGFMYLFANQGWHDSVQGPPEDRNRGGGVFKLRKSVDRPWGPHYVFHNSFSVRSDYARKGILPELEQWANAIRYSDTNDPVFDGSQARIFGDLGAPVGDPSKRFTTRWGEFGIEMHDDAVRYPGWPQTLRDHQYPIGPSTGVDPHFVEPFRGNLRLQDDSPCRGTAPAIDIRLPDGTRWCRAAGADLGAWQDDSLFDGPSYRDLSNDPHED